ncbi:MAG: hypothetical protein QM754_16375 [Tepidisphaeraceae bacterium]
MAALSQRAEIGFALGNGRNIDYPVGMDYQFTRLLDSLRHWVVKVRVTLAADRYHLPEGGEVREGHLRRYAGCDDQPWFSQMPKDDLALHRQIDDRQSVFGFCPREPFNDYARIARIEIIDPLLLGQSDPAVIWEATDDQRAGWTLARQKSLARERFRAKCVIVHLSIIVCVMVGSFVPALRAWWAGERLQTVGWAVAAFLISMFTWATIAFWEDGPDLGVLRRRDT